MQIPAVKGGTMTCALRVPVGIVEMIDSDITTNREHSNRSEWILCAIHMYLDARKLRGGGGAQAPREE